MRDQPVFRSRRSTGGEDWLTTINIMTLHKCYKTIFYITFYDRRRVFRSLWLCFYKSHKIYWLFTEYTQITLLNWLSIKFTRFATKQKLTFVCLFKFLLTTKVFFWFSIEICSQVELITGATKAGMENANNLYLHALEIYIIYWHKYMSDCFSNLAVRVDHWQTPRLNLSQLTSSTLTQERIE